MEKLIGALDQGTTSTRFILFNHRGEIVGAEQKEHRQIFPKSGWVEHDPMEIWDNARQVIRAALARAGIKSSELAAIGVTNQRETTVVWDRNTGQPYCNAIVWQCTDARNLPHLNQYGRAFESGRLPVATYFQDPSSVDLDNVPDAERARRKGDALLERN
jgi:glycerol kinase